MAVSIEHLINKISGEHQKTLKFFKGLPETIWAEHLYTDGEEWNVHEVLAHIVEAEGSFLQLFSDIAGGGTGVGLDFDIDRHNANEVSKISIKSRDELFSLFDERRAKMLELVGELSPNALGNTGNHPYLGEARLEEMLRLYLLHINIHIRDIRKAFGDRWS